MVEPWRSVYLCDGEDGSLTGVDNLQGLIVNRDPGYNGGYESIARGF